MEWSLPHNLRPHATALPFRSSADHPCNISMRWEVRRCAACSAALRISAAVAHRHADIVGEQVRLDEGWEVVEDPQRCTCSWVLQR